MARQSILATSGVAIAAVLGMAAIANAAQDDAARWPGIYEPQWPNVTGTTDTNPQKPAVVTAAQKPATIPPPPVLSAPETIVTGSAPSSVPPSPVAKRWHDFKAAETIVVPAFQGEFGLRYWMMFGETAKNLYTPSGNAMASRLSYDGLQGHAIEAYGRVDHTSGFYMKGMLASVSSTAATSTTRTSRPEFCRIRPPTASSARARWPMPASISDST